MCPAGRRDPGGGLSSGDEVALGVGSRSKALRSPPGARATRSLLRHGHQRSAVHLAAPPRLPGSDHGASGAPYRDLTILRRLARHARPFWPQIGGILLLGLVATPLALLIPLPLKVVVDSVLDTQPLPGFLRTALPASVSQNANGILLLAAGLTVVASLLLHLQASLTWLLQTYVGERMTLQFRAQLFRKAQRLSISHHDAEGSADSIYRIQYDALALRDLVIHGLLPLVSSGITVAAMVYVTVRVDWQIALIALGVLPLLYVLTSVSRRRLRRAWLEVKEIERPRCPWFRTPWAPFVS
jgi:ATP-binding cassette subfamily B protein